MAREPSLEIIDWRLARSVALAVAGSQHAAGPFSRADSLSLKSEFAELTARADDMVREFTGLATGSAAPRVVVLDRRGWAEANLIGIRRLLTPFASHLASRPAPPRSGPARTVVRAGVRAGLGAEIGGLLGYLSGRVLGQFDLLRPEDPEGLVYYVGPNVLGLEAEHHLPSREFRLWVALHEVTHAAQFNGVAWLREYFRSLVSDYFTAAEKEGGGLVEIFRRARLALTGARRGERADLIGILAGPAQREVISRMQALMSVLEGHGDFVMDRLGAGVIPHLDSMRRMVEARRASATGVNRAFQRLVGIEMKLAQYRAGAAFVGEVEARAGSGGIERLFSSPEALPRLDEIVAPTRWLDRVGYPGRED